MKKLLNYVLTVYALLVLGSASLAMAASSAVSWGNNSENILNGGVIAADASGRVYYSETEKNGALYVSYNDSEKRLSSDSASNINVIGNTVYYSTRSGSGAAVYSVTTAGKNRTKLFTAKKAIEEMYVRSDGSFYILAGGKVYFKKSASAKSEVLAKGNITHFIPTSHGIIYAKGSKQNYTVYADGKKVSANVFSFYVYDNYLLFTKDKKDYQVSVHDLFGGSGSAKIRAYTLGNNAAALSNFAQAEDDCDCEECQANARAAAAAGAIASASSRTDSTAVKSASASGITSILTTDKVSQGQKNMVKRARQQHEIRWTPVKDISSWGNSSTFKAGVTYSGLPYGQPVRAKYVPWAASLEEFIAAVNDGGSLMYTARSSYNRSAPYYSCDCSSFVSWSWDLPSRQYTRSIGAYATLVESQSIYSAQVGDAFCKPGSHVVMVSDVGYRGDQIVYIDIMEQTPPQTKYTRWGEGGTKPLSELYGKYFGKGYSLIRSKTRDNVQFRASTAVVIDGNDGSAAPSYAGSSVTLSESAVELELGSEKQLTYRAGTAGSPRWISEKTSVATVDSTGKIKAVSAGSTKITLWVGSVSASAMVYVHPAQVVLKAAKATASGAVKISWKASAGAEGYEVLRKDASGAYVTVGTTAKTSYTDSSTAKNTTYTYSVRGLVKKADGSNAAGTYNINGVSCRTILDTPVLKKVVMSGVTAQTISWNAVPGAEGYTVYKRTAKTKWAALGNTASQSFKATGLTPNVKYYYTVRAYFTANGKQVLGGYNANGIGRKALPGTPVLQSATPSAQKKVLVKWKKVSGVSTYKVFRKAPGRSKWTEVATTYSNRYVDTDVDFHKEYSYTVRAMYRYGTKKIFGGYSKKGISVTVWPGEPALKGAASNAAGEATIAWTKAAGAKGYYVYAKTNGGKWKEAARCSAKASSVTLKGLQTGTEYTFTVRGYWTLKGEIAQSDYNAAGVSVTVK